MARRAIPPSASANDSWRSWKVVDHRTGAGRVCLLNLPTGRSRPSAPHPRFIKGKTTPCTRSTTRRGGTSNNSATTLVTGNRVEAEMVKVAKVASAVRATAGSSSSADSTTQTPGPERSRRSWTIAPTRPRPTRRLLHRMLRVTRKSSASRWVAEEVQVVDEARVEEVLVEAKAESDGRCR